MAKSKSLQEYEEKRSFSATPEPGAEPASGAGGPLRFAVQLHDATRLHWDLRLEFEDSLLSFAVPKGPSLNPEDKRLAVKTENHPLKYLWFEEVIPEGNYGAGPMVVWDLGTYAPDEPLPATFDDREESERRIRQGLKDGKLSLTFRGARMRGSFTLVHMKDEWLLIKHKDGFVSDRVDLSATKTSIFSGLTPDQLAAGQKAALVDLDKVEGTKHGLMPRKVVPMLCTDVPKPSDDDAWSWEVKHDGIRCIAFVENGKVRLQSRNGIDITDRFPALTEELGFLRHPKVVLDGEIVLLTPEGHASFPKLMQRFQLTSPHLLRAMDVAQPIEFHIFDLLNYGGWDLRDVKLKDRQELLKRAGIMGATTRTVDVFRMKGSLLYEHALKMGFEGIIGKKVDSKYKEGQRGPTWVKVKKSCSGEYLIGGYTAGAGMRASAFGALMLGAQEENGLRWVGNTGGGFTDAQLKEVKQLLEPYKTNKKPFVNAVEGDNPTWLAPELWVEVQYMETTPEGYLRMPVYKRMRPDLSLKATVKERTEDEPSTGENALAKVLEQLEEDHPKDFTLEVEGHTIKISNPQKVLWPIPGYRKIDLIRYYARVSPYILPHLKDRPLSYVRGPNGVNSELFFQKHIDKGRPDFMRPQPIWSNHNNKASDYPLVDGLASLLWMAQLGTLEIHPWYSRAAGGDDVKGIPLDTWSNDEALDESVLDYPDFLVVDLDPHVPDGKENDIEALRKAFQSTVPVAIKFKETLDAMKLEVYLKTSGKSGLHIFVPIERNLHYPAVRLLCETFGRHLMSQMPEQVTMEWSVSKRPAKVFFDHNQNVRGKTLVGIYSPRAAQSGAASFPITWDELETINPADYRLENIPDLLAEKGDLWADILEHKHDLRSMVAAK